MAVLTIFRYRTLLQYSLFQAFKNKAKASFAGNKGFIKDPLLYWGVFAAIFLSGTIILTSKIAPDSHCLWDFSFLSADVSEKISSPNLLNLFAESAKGNPEDAPQINFLQQNSAFGASSPLMVNARTLGTLSEDAESTNRKTITEYVVQSSDTLSSIAQNSGVSLETIIWANDLTASSKIRAGQKLVIPPATGIIYHVKKGDTLSDIAQIYKGKTDEIITFNELSGEGDIFIGDILIIPNGKMPSSPKLAPAPAPQTPIASSYFICPHSACKITQGLHYYNAIDFGGKCGDPIFAAAGGVVQKVKFGWNYGAGNYISVLHPNGVVTNYGHISTSLVSPGQEVSQGTIIALMGGKPGTPGAGISTGCHVHFAVYGGRNPFAR